jgi:hypothetical protein
MKLKGKNGRKKEREILGKEIQTKWACEICKF